MSERSSSLSPRPIDFDSLRSRISKLRNVDGNPEFSAVEMVENFTDDIGLEIERKINWISSEWVSNLSSLSSEDLEEILRKLTTELGEVETENVAIEHEIEEDERRCVEDYNILDSELEKLSCLLDFMESQNEGAKENPQIDVSCLVDRARSSTEHGSKFKILELSHQIEEKKAALKSMQDLDSIFERFEAVEKIEEAFTGLKVIEIEGNSIRLSLKTYIPYLETALRKQDIENIIEPVEINHELIVETDDMLELKNAEIFPNDIHIGDIVKATKSSSQQCSAFTVQTRSSLESLVRRVQDRIALSSLRRFVVKNLIRSRHSFEYLEREDTVVAHMVGGIDAFIKLPQGWPLSDLPLELMSIKSTSQYMKEVSLSFICKILEKTNAMNVDGRHKISTFADCVEEILMQQKRDELQRDSFTAK